MSKLGGGGAGRVLSGKGREEEGKRKGRGREEEGKRK